MNINEAKDMLGDCNFMRSYFRHEIVDTVKWLLHRVEKLEENASQPTAQADAEPCICDRLNPLDRPCVYCRERAVTRTA